MKKYHLVPIVSLIHGTDFVVSISENNQHRGFIKEEGNGEPNYTEKTSEFMDAYRWSTVSQVLEWAYVQGITIWGKLKVEMYWKGIPQYIEGISPLSSSPQEMAEIVRKFFNGQHPSIRPNVASVIKVGIGARYLHLPYFIHIWSFKYCPGDKVVHHETII